MNIDPRSTRALVLLLVIGAVGAVVRFGGFFGDWFAKYGGDAVWASAWVFALLVVWPRLGRNAVWVGFLICCAIEVFQLTGIPAALAVRGFVFRLVLGSQFGWMEIPAYFAGAVLTIPFIGRDTRANGANTL